MSKLRLDLDALRVESFETVAGAAAERGTVRAHDDSLDPGGPSRGATCGLTCPASCPPSCPGTCFWTCDTGTGPDPDEP